MERSHSVFRSLFSGRNLFALSLFVYALAPLYAQIPASAISVVPLARSAAFTVRLDQVAPARYSATEYGPLYDPNPVATLDWRVPGESRWKSAQPFVRVQSDRFRSCLLYTSRCV